jgi:hypothetical protein
MLSHNPQLGYDQVLFLGELSSGSFSDVTPEGPLEETPGGSQYEPYHPYTFSYGSSENVEAFNRPLVFAPPLPDPNNLDHQDVDQDSTIGDQVSVRSLLVDDSGYQWRHEHGRRYHGRFEGLHSDYHLPNGIPLTSLGPSF